MGKCFRCNKVIPDADIKESVAREMDWRDWLDDHPTDDNDKRVLICMECADELEEAEEYS